MRITRLYLRNYRVYEDELDLELPPGLVGLYGPNGAGKCLPGPTRVWDADRGEGVAIEQFVRGRRKWMLGCTGGTVAPVEVTDWHELGPKPTVVVRLASGAEVEVAATHPLLTRRGCVPASDLATGDEVAEARRLPAVSPPFVTEVEAFLLGLVLGARGAGPPASVPADDGDVVAAFRAAVELTFPGSAVETVPGDGVVAARCVALPDRDVAAWARSFGPVGDCPGTARLPPSLLLLPDEPACHLLAGVWLAGGSLGAGGDGLDRLPPGDVAYCSPSPGLADDVRILLLRLGIASTRRSRPLAGSLVHEVVVAEGSLAGMARLPLPGAHGERARSLAGAVPPPSAGGDVEGRSAAGDVAWSAVVSVTPTGREVPCFDVTVDTPEHLYVAETLIGHNSYLAESVLWTLFGHSRTSKEEIRTADVNADCVTEVEFEHEGHLYLVRRTLSGINATVKARAEADGAQVAEGVQSVRRYVHSVLGMDAAAFRASVFAEQKQLASFSGLRPGERKDLVLRLLGITPLDRARDDVRRDARAAQTAFDHLRRVLPDLDALTVVAEDAEAAAGARSAEAEGEEAAARTAREALAAVERRVEAVEALRREHEALVAEGKAARAEHEGAVREGDRLRGELAELTEIAATVDDLEATATGLDEAEVRLRLVEAVVTARRALAAVPVPEAVEAPDEGAEAACEAARREAEAEAGRLAEVAGARRAAVEAEARAREALARSAELSAGAECPLCGQELGDAFERVQGHRSAELEEAATRVRELDASWRELEGAVAASRAQADAAATALRRARVTWAASEEARARRAAAERAAGEAEALVRARLGPAWRADDAGAEAEVLSAEVRTRRAAATAWERARGRLERRPAVEAALEEVTARAAGAWGAVEALREKVRALGFRQEDFDEARAALASARARAERSDAAAHQARLVAARARAEADAAATALARGREQHEALEAKADDARHLGRTAELLAAFRDTVVATVGPRLSTQAAELFAELTDHEYDRLEVDASTYEIQIRDRGRLYGMDRFSGSETDLANLALRVAISEHVRLLSGGAVGLLVLDEVFGPLDDDRKARMLSALERLKSRFRQVLVVTHDDAIKAELPHALEVVKLPGRRATARLVHA